MENDENKSSEWTTVGSSPMKKSHREKENTSQLQELSSPSHLGLSPYPIKRCPVGNRIEDTIRMLMSVVSTGPETKRLFDEVVQDIYPKFLILLRGPPGSGKSTLAKSIFAVTQSGVICSADDFFLDSKTGLYNHNPALLSEAHGQCKRKCLASMKKAISPIVIDNTNIRRFEMDEYAKFGVEYNYQIKIFELETSWTRNSKILSKKTIHGVPRAKIDEMIDKYEQIVPFSFINDARRSLGAAGVKYSPPKNATKSIIDFTKTKAKLNNSDISNFFANVSQQSSLLVGGEGGPPAPTLSEFFEEGLKNASQFKQGTSNYQHMKLEKGLTTSTNSRMAAVFPNKCNWGDPNDSNKFLKDQNLSHPGERKKISRRASASGAHSLDFNKCSVNDNKKDIVDPSSSETPSASTSSIKTVQAYFPTCPHDVVQACWIECHEDVDESINSLLDQGYEINVFDEYCHSPKINETTKGSSIANSEPFINFNKEKYVEPMLEEKFELETAEGQNNPRQDSPNDGDNWLDLTLPDPFVNKINGIYGCANTSTTTLTAEEKKIRIPPSLALDLFCLFNEQLDK